MVYVVEYILYWLYTNECVSMGITRHDTEMHGEKTTTNDQQNDCISDTYCVCAKAAG